MTERRDDAITVGEPPLDVAPELPVVEVPAAAHVRARAARAIAHRVRTPLSLVISPIHSALDQTGLDERLRRQLQIALDQSEQVRADLDELTEIVTWPDELDMRPLRLGDLLAEVGLMRLAGETWHGLTYTIDTEDTAEAMCDEIRMRWTLDVLLRAAIEAAPPEGHIALRCEDEGDEVVASLAVHSAIDSAADVGDAQSRRPVVGVAETIAELHGGVIERGTDGPAARLDLRLPSAGSSAPTERTWNRPVRDEGRDVAGAAAPSGSVAPGGDADVVGPDGAPLILIVEDDPVLRGFLTEALSVDHRVITANSAEDAVSIVERVRPDLVACDLLLPGASGEHLVRRLHDDPELVGIPIIVVSGRNDDERRVRMLRDGVDDYITKPFSSEELRARIANLLSRHGGIDDLRERAARAQEVATQLQRALDSRIVIEQAKAFVASERRISVDEAFEVLRRHARSHNLKLREVAEAVVEGFRP